MKYKRFDVVELKDKNRATILDIVKNHYIAEIVNDYVITIDKRKLISNEDIIKGIYIKNTRQ